MPLSEMLFQRQGNFGNYPSLQVSFEMTVERAHRLKIGSGRPIRFTS